MGNTLLVFGVVMLMAAAVVGEVNVVRFDGNPIIRPDMLEGKDGRNINGPSLIRVPEWVQKPLGKYYLYFAHHGGTYIRMAYADRLEGPWKIRQGGVLRLKDAPGAKGHIASPDVIVDAKRREIRMYFHGPAAKGGGQMTFAAVSRDGLAFEAGAEALGPFYFRVFVWQGQWYALAKGGAAYRSADGLKPFERGPSPFPAADPKDEQFNASGSIRHVAVDLRGDVMWVYYSRIGDKPERILRQRVQLEADWAKWKAGPAEEVLRPEMEYEGVKLPLAASVSGAAKGPEHAVRDPAIFVEDGRTWLLYSVAGESGIGLAELRDK